MYFWPARKHNCRADVILREKVATSICQFSGERMFTHESLESRRLFSGVRTINLLVPVTHTDVHGRPNVHVTSTGTLVIGGSSSSEDITVGTRRNGRIAVDFRRTNLGPGGGLFVYEFAFSASKVKRLDIGGSSGNDSIAVNVNLSGRSNVRGGGGDDTITVNGRRLTAYGGDGNDVLSSETRVRSVQPVTMGDSSGSTTIQVIDATYNTLYGDAGNDTLTSTGGEDSLIGGAGTDQLVTENAVEKHVGGLPALQQMTDVYTVTNRVSVDSLLEYKPTFESKEPIYTLYGSLDSTSFA